MCEPVLFPDEKLIEINDRLSLIQKKDGLCFGTDAYLLSAFVREHTVGYGADLGSGSGVIAMLLARRHPSVTVYAVELQHEYACENGVIARNISLNRLESRVVPLESDVRDLHARVFDRELDFVVSNPPYMRADSGKRNVSASKDLARHAVNGDIAEFCAAAARILRYGGLFYVVYRPDRLVDLICALRENQLEPKRIRFVAQRPEAAPSMVLIEAKKGAKPSVVIPETLFLQAGESVHPAMQAIYEGGWIG